MRFASVSALVLTGFALAACTGESGDTTCGTLAITPTGPCVATATPTGSTTPVAGAPIAPTGTTGTSAGGGNTSGAASGGNTTLAFNGSNLDTPTTGTSLSKLAFDPLAAIKPTKQKFSIDTMTKTNGYWSTPIEMDEYLPGTNAPPGPGNNGGAGTGYREYLAITSNGSRDEVLQVWAWQNSYATQYLNKSGGGEGRQHAWSFGGNKTPIGGSATYNGRFVAVAKTEGFEPPLAPHLVEPNALWRVQGASTLSADFGTKTIDGTLTSETWTTRIKGVEYTKTVGVPDGEADYSFYNSKIDLKGKIDETSLTDYSGTATLLGDYSSFDNPLKGGFFGPGANETAGVFNVKGLFTYPSGGGPGGITDPVGATVTINGAFHGCNPACP